jgi:hypothetical protein
VEGLGGRKAPFKKCDISVLIQPSKIVTGYILLELQKPAYKALHSLERVMQARNGEVVNVLITIGVHLWQTENGRAMLRRLLHEFRTTARCKTMLPAVEPEEGQGQEPSTWADRRGAVRQPHSPASPFVRRMKLYNSVC